MWYGTQCWTVGEKEHGNLGLFRAFSPFVLQQTADKKKEGNDAFSNGKFTAAISVYTRALHMRYVFYNKIKKKKKKRKE